MSVANETLVVHLKRVKAEHKIMQEALKRIAEFQEYEPAGPAALTATDALAKVEGF